jgi:hypothetical protein
MARSTAILVVAATLAGWAGAEAGAASQAAQVQRKGVVYHVGPSRQLRTPSQAARLVRDGDVVLIDAGVYRDCAVWRANRLVLRGVGGLAHVKDISCEGKAIWVIYGHAVKVENMRFSGSRVANRNGAGIRFQGGLLVVRNSHFYNNQMGILTHNKRKSWLVVESSTFQQNGDCSRFCGHGVYAGSITGLRIVGSTFRFHKFGHHIKSRALRSEIIGNRITDGAIGTSSFSINIPNGGTAVIRNNVMEKGARSDNAMAMISIGEEGVKNPSQGSIISNNVFKNDHRRRTRFVWNRSNQPLRMIGNRFSGKGVKLKGSGVVVN